MNIKNINRECTNTNTRKDKSGGYVGSTQIKKNKDMLKSLSHV